MKYGIVFFIILALAITSCKKDPLQEDPYKDTADYDTRCHMHGIATNGCIHNAALYNWNVAICDEIGNSTEVQICKEEIAHGRRMFREMINGGKSLQLDSNPFANRCKTECDNKGLVFRTLGKDGHAGSVDVALTFNNDTKEFGALSVCTCFSQ